MKFKCIVADPPWQPSLHKDNPRRRTIDLAGPQRFYPTMPVSDIASLPISDLAEEQSHLWLWVINQHIDWGYMVARAWGFEPQQMVTWCKKRVGVGGFQCNTEHILVCRRGGHQTMLSGTLLAHGTFGRQDGTARNRKHRSTSSSERLLGLT